MRNIFITSVFLCSIFSLNAQIAISFEENEGFTLGNINDQQGWKTFNSLDFYIENEYIEEQDITSEESTDGNQSLRVTSIETFPEDYDGIFGVYKNLETIIPFSNGTEISFDILINQINYSDYYINFFRVDNNLEPTGGFLFGFGFDGEIEIILNVLEDGDYEVDYTGHDWEPNTWMHCALRVEDNIVKYFINDTLIGQTPKYFSEFNYIVIDTSDYGGHMYIDNININDETMSVNELTTGEKINIAKQGDSIMIINTKSDFNVIIYNSLGQLVKKSSNKELINIQDLEQGVYFINIETSEGVTKHKFFK